jgi:hypothetical protein
VRFRADRRKESQSRRRSSLGSRTFRPLREQWRLITGTLGGMISSEKLKVTVCLAGTGAFLLGGFMFVGTLLLGHARPMWMEFEYAPHYALYGLVAGGVLGLAIDWWRASASNRTKQM